MDTTSPTTTPMPAHSEQRQIKHRPIRFNWREYQGMLAVQAMNKPGIERSAVKGDQ